MRLRKESGGEKNVVIEQKEAGERRGEAQEALVAVRDVGRDGGGKKRSGARNTSGSPSRQASHVTRVDLATQHSSSPLPRAPPSFWPQFPSTRSSASAVHGSIAAGPVSAQQTRLSESRAKTCAALIVA